MKITPRHFPDKPNQDLLVLEPESEAERCQLYVLLEHIKNKRYVHRADAQWGEINSVTFPLSIV